MIGQMQMLDKRRVIDHWKARGLDFSRLFHKPDAPDGVAIHRCERQDHGLDEVARPQADRGGAAGARGRASRSCS